jgi:hypothetical protein
MAMKKKGAAKGGVRKMKSGDKIESERTKARNASIAAMGKINSPSAKKRRAAEAKANAAVLAKNARKIKTQNMSKGVGSGDDRYTQADDQYERIGREGYEKPSRFGGRPERKVNTGNMPKLKAGGKVAKKKAGGAVTKKKAGGAVTKKMGGGKMMKKGYAKGGKLAKMSKGGRGTIARGSGAARPQRFRKNG